jgi:hypothetical protein
MARRRSGLFEAPNVQTPQISVASDTADISGLYRSLAQAAEEVSTRILTPMINQDSAEAGARDAREGRFNEEAAFLPGAEYYNNALRVGYAASISGQVARARSTIEQQFPDDPDGFQSAMEAARDSFIEAAPADMAVVAGSEWAEQIVSGVSATAQRRTSISLQAAQDTAEAELERLETQMSGINDLTGDEYLRLYQQYSELGAARSRNPLMGMPPAEWELRRDTFHGNQRARVLADTAVNDYERGISEGRDGATVARETLAALELAVNDQENPLLITAQQRNATINMARAQIRAAEAERRRLEADYQRQRNEIIRDITPGVRDSLGEVQERARRFELVPDEALGDLGEIIDQIDNPTLSADLAQLRRTLAVRQDASHRSTSDIATEIADLDAVIAAAESNATPEEQERARAYLAQNQITVNDAVTRLNALDEYVRHIRESDPVDTIYAHGGERPHPLGDNTAPLTAAGLTGRIRQIDDYAQAMIIPNEGNYLSEQEVASFASVMDRGGPNAVILARTIVDASADATSTGIEATQLAGSIFRQIGLTGGPRSSAYVTGNMLAISGDARQGLLNIGRIQAHYDRRASTPNYVDETLTELPGAERTSIINEMLGAAFYADGTREYARMAADAILAESHVTQGLSGSFENEYRAAVQAAMGGLRGTNFSWGGVTDSGQFVPNWIARNRFDSVVRSVMGNPDTLRAATGVLTPEQWSGLQASGARLEPRIGNPGEYTISYLRNGTRITLPIVVNLNNVRQRLYEDNDRTVIRSAR